MFEHIASSWQNYLGKARSLLEVGLDGGSTSLAE